MVLVGDPCPPPPAPLIIQLCLDGSSILVGSTDTCPPPPPPPSVLLDIADSLIPDAGIGTKDPYFMAGCVLEENPAGCYTNADGDVANILDADRFIYHAGINLLHRRLEGTGARQGATIPLSMDLVPQDVRRAWRDGWTGSGVNILIYDVFGSSYWNLYGSVRGYMHTASALSIAPAANYYALESDFVPGGDISVRRMSDDTGAIQYIETRIEVVKWLDVVSVRNLPSIDLFDPNNPMAVLNPRTGKPYPIRSAELREIQQEKLNTDILRYLTGRSYTYPDIDLRDAVYVQPAGNRKRPISHPGEISGLMLDYLEDSITHRILVVGALNRYAQHDRAEIPEYSNYPGNGTVYQANFLVEYGGSPFAGDGSVVLCGGWRISTCPAHYRSSGSHAGTEYAAARVAGFAALVRQKFPDLNGAQTARILLDTATYEGLACYPNCATSQYGQGRVDILDALSPIGKLQ